ncbi:MAG: HAD family phosphatase [Deltaproteobacteria bacterium]|nr:HAD family phosphatase [Deltaproteobacteria bacterium]MBW2072123.1 HAD family phosphatase [Deltaproteobacteria bacterium]
MLDHVSKKRLALALFDIDGTLRRVRDPWVQLHQYLGVHQQAEGLVELWQRREISYEEWARLDASLWRGYSRQTMAAALQENPLRKGARELIAWFRAKSIPCVAISTGLSVFNDITARDLGLAEVISNELHFDGGVCTGRIIVKVGEDNKGAVMREILARYRVGTEQVVAFGDGRADIPVLAAAGLGVAVCPYADEVARCADHVVASEPIDSALEVVQNHFHIPG